MNFVVVMFDTLRADYLGCYGNEWVETPTLDGLARQSAVFDRAYAASWPTVPNRTDLFTGRYGEPLHAWRPLSWEAVTLPELMRKEGYVTQLILDTPHIINFGFGFDRPFHAWWLIRGNECDRWRTDSDPVQLTQPLEKTNKAILSFYTQYLRNIRERRLEEDYFAPQVFSAAMRWLEENRDHEQFFLWIDCFDPHEPWDPPRHYLDRYDPGYAGEDVPAYAVRSKECLSERELRHLRARYAGEVTMVDRWFGRFLERLQDLGLADDTAVIVCSDHGTYLGAHGQVHKAQPLYEEVARIVWMMKLPRGRWAGKRIPALVQPPDLMPTVLELAGIACPETVQGKSLLPLLEGEKESLRSSAITGWAPMPWSAGPLAVTDGEWTLIDFPDRSRWELYHLPEDPGQLKNVVGEFPQEAGHLHEQTITFLQEHDAPPETLEWYCSGPPPEPRPVPPEGKIFWERGLHCDNLLLGRFVEQVR